MVRREPEEPRVIAEPGPSAVVDHFRALASSGAWDTLYNGPASAANVSFRVRLAHAVRLVPPEARRVLDVGCGPAPLADPLIGRGHSYVGADAATEMLERARRRRPDVALVRCGLPLPFGDAAFDALTALGFLEYFEDPVAVLTEFHRVLKPGGSVVVSIPKKWHLDLLMVRLLAPARALAAALLGRRSDRLKRTLLTPTKLHEMASRAGLFLSEGTHYHYTPVPYPATVLVPRLVLPVNRWFEDRLPAVSFVAHGYLARYMR